MIVATKGIFLKMIFAVLDDTNGKTGRIIRENGKTTR
jgi:hypothetical protein